MNLDSITTKPYILALFIRDDNERFLLGLGAYEFKSSQLHFSANSMINDIVEVQGSDGALLAGQVRRASVQTFDGFIGDGSTIKSKVEEYRTNFIAFFSKNHFYKVIYVFSDGSAIQRRRGYIVDSPQVKELYQSAPEYHIGLNFEDVNYYKYSEDSDGNETFSDKATIQSIEPASGGLIWEDYTSTGTTTATVEKEGTSFSIANTKLNDGLNKVELKGNTTQNTQSGKNLFNKSDRHILNYYYFDGSQSTSTISSGGSRNGLIWISCRPSTTYSITVGSLTGISQIQVGDSATTPANGVSVDSLGKIGANLKLEGITTHNTAQFLVLRVQTNSGVDVATKWNAVFDNAQIEIGATATAYEQYYGLSPNPDYTQAVNVVAGKQTITISDKNGQSQEFSVNLASKNLFDQSQATQYRYISDSDGSIATSGNSATFAGVFYIPCEPNTSYTLSGGTAYMRIAEYNSSKTFIQIVNSGNSSDPVTITTGANAAYIRASYNDTTGTANIQLEKGSTATTYEAYWVYKLAKIGNYQDYIYKSGDDWYIHKETGNISLDATISGLTDASAGQTNASSHGAFFISKSDWNSAGGDYDATIAHSPLMSSNIGKFQMQTLSGNADANTMVDGTMCQRSGTNDRIYFRHSGFIGKTGNEVKAILQSQGGANFFYPLTTATDTKITEASLVSDLNALANGTCYGGATIFNSNGNLSAILDVEVTTYHTYYLGGGVVWDNIGAEWEEGGGSSETTITVDSISEVYPMITINGPANNPTLTNITTGQSIVYSGNISAMQTLVIDVNQKTAKLNGTSVIGNVSGSWLWLNPGNNRLSYSITSATPNDAIIEWQGVVG